MESLESLAGKRSALRPLRGDGPRRAAIKGERERLLDDLKRSCLGESDRDLLMDVRNQVRHKKLTETGTCVQILSSPLARDGKQAFGLLVVKNAACAAHPRSLDPEQNWDKAKDISVLTRNWFIQLHTFSIFSGSLIGVVESASILGPATSSLEVSWPLSSYKSIR